jgi:hypothetical protein
MLERILFQNYSTAVNWWITFYSCAMHKGTIYDILVFKSVDTNRPTIIIIITVIFIKKIQKKDCIFFINIGLLIAALAYLPFLAYCVST